MNRTVAIALFLALGLYGPTSVASGVYKWVDSAGRVHYSDQPPPPDVRQARQISGRGNVVEVDKESFDTRQARERSPVQLFSSACGPMCDQATEHLRKRGIPFTLRDPTADPEHAVALKKLAGVMEVPVIAVGQAHLKGYDAAAWDAMLDAAGYPRTSLPSERARPAR